MTFDRLAPIYNQLEQVTAGSRLQAARTWWLGALTGRRRLLSAGEGHGRFAAACAARFPGLQMTCVDASAGMLRQAREAAGPAGDRIEWVHATLPGWAPPGKFDAIATCFFLDCFPADALRSVVAGIAAAATDDASWIVVDFAVPASGLARWRARAVHWIMYAFFRAVVDLPARSIVDPAPFLEQHGFKLAGRREFEWGLVRADLYIRETRGL